MREVNIRRLEWKMEEVLAKLLPDARPELVQISIRTPEQEIFIKSGHVMRVEM